jgi:hypothetical protein
MRAQVHPCANAFNPELGLHLLTWLCVKPALLA